jgi:hypothetical protein
VCADHSCDGLIRDWVVLSRMRRTEQHVDDARQRVEAIWARVTRAEARRRAGIEES